MTIKVKAYISQHENQSQILLFLLGLFFIWSIYLLPLYHSPLFVETYDNLDSNIVWYKILAHSNQIFAPNNAIIPNMMNGLPRVSYPSEVSLEFWLHYFFSPSMAYRINVFLLHTTAYFSMYVFLLKYPRDTTITYRKVWIVLIALFYATIPYWTPGGMTIPLLPLYIYILLNIYHDQEKWYEWIMLIFLPFCSSLILFYAFFITFLFFFLVYELLTKRHLHRKLFLAFCILVVLFVFTEYRLVMEFVEKSFISHRSEFNIYFNDPLKKAYVDFIHFFLHGSDEHQHSTIMPILLPVILIATLLPFFKKQFTKYTSLLIWVAMILSLSSDFWYDLLENYYAVPLIFLFVTFAALISKTYRLFYVLIALQILLAWYNGFCFYEGFAFLKEWFGILNTFNISRAAFVQPFLWAIILFYAFNIYLKHLKYSIFFIPFIFALHLYFTFGSRAFSDVPQRDMLSFRQYYSPSLFEKIKHEIPHPLSKHRIINYGLDPAISLYNGLYTIDGYSPNYPLTYKNKFRQSQPQCIEPTHIGNLLNGNKKIYNEWGSKLYLLCIDSVSSHYKKHTTPFTPTVSLIADVKGLCALHADYLISAYPITRKDTEYLEKLGDYGTPSDYWHLWLYRLKCNNFIKRATGELVP